MFSTGISEGYRPPGGRAQDDRPLVDIPARRPVKEMIVYGLDSDSDEEEEESIEEVEKTEKEKKEAS